MKSFELNGKKITPKAITFNTICELEEKGYDISEMGTKTMSFIRIFVAMWTGKSIEDAGNEIEEHISNGGDISVVLDALSDAINESGFFNGSKGKKLKKTPEPTENDT